MDVPIIAIKTSLESYQQCKLDYKVKMHTEILKRKCFLSFLDMMYSKQKALTPHTYVQGTTHLDHLP
jgi:hypothetical protein